MHLPNYSRCSQKKGVVSRCYPFNLFHHFLISLSLSLLQKTKRFTLQIETCIRIMKQINIPTCSFKRFWQQFYPILFLLFTMLIMIVTENRILISYGINYWTAFLIFYLYRYHIIILFINDFSFLFWIGQVIRFTYRKIVIYTIFFSIRVISVSI